MVSEKACKICGSESLIVFAHTARCKDCRVLLYYPYPEDDKTLVESGTGKWKKEEIIDWYARSSFLNHGNFTHMLRFAMDRSYVKRKLDILDYGGGGGQFALVCKSHFPQSTVYITDISDEALLDEYAPLNVQIPFAEFDTDPRKFDVIFMNDVFEHVSDPVFVLKQLAGKLKPEGKIFVDTPRPFWIYPVARLLSKSLYTKVLRGTVSKSHLQIWSKDAFDLVVEKAGLKGLRYEEVSEYTQAPSHYIRNMGIENPLLKFAAHTFYRFSPYLAKNKIVAVLVPA